MLLMTLAKSIRTGRKSLGKGRRIGTLTAYLKRLAETVGESRLAKHMEVSREDIRGSINNANGKFVWFDPDNASVAGSFKTVDGKTITTGATLGKKEDDSGYTVASGSIMDFDCVITTSRRDRDGDVLDPKGAIVDPKMPLLWQHVPYQPIGRMVRLLDQSEEKVTARFMIADTLLGRDAAVLIEAGCLRISHGFSPIEYNPLKDDSGKDMGGWRINKYAMMETSVVSIPSNIDAEITQSSRGKLHHPLMKHWCDMLRKGQPKMVRSGFDGANLNLTINLKGLPAASVKADTPPTDDDEDDEDEKEDEVDDEEDDETEDKDDDADDDADAGKQGKLLGELIDSARELSKNGAMPKEAQRRMGVVDGLLEDIEAGIADHADKLAEAAKNRDLVGIFTATSDLTAGCVGQLRSVCEELGRIAGIADVPDDAIKQIQGIASEAEDIVNAVNTLSTNMDEGDDDKEEPDDMDDGKEGEEEEDDKDDDMDEEEGKEGDADDDDDEDRKEDDDDDNEEKENDNELDPDEENPEVDDEVNPGMGSAAAGGIDRIADRLLGLHLTGKRLSKGAKETLRIVMADDGDGDNGGRAGGRSPSRPARRRAE